MATIKGIWKFNDELNLVDINQIVNFSCGDYTNQTEIQIIVADTGNRIMLKPAFTNIYRAESGWSNEKYQVIDFGETKQEVSDEFANWLFQNANNGKVVFPSVNEGNIKVPIKENGTTTLATAGTYCATDIDVNVEVEDKSEEAFEAGKKSEYDAFWDEFQQNGNRENYDCAFANWTPSLLTPKYNLIPTGAYMMFRSVTITDLVQHFEEQGIIFDTSNATSLQYTFLFSAIKRIGIINTKGAPILSQTFESCQAQTIDKIVLKDDGSQTFHHTFHYMDYLENLVIEGIIGQEGFNIQYSPFLSKASITSIINALSDTTTNLTITLSLTAVNNAFETTESAADGSTSEEWLALTETKSNWTISLV